MSYKAEWRKEDEKRNKLMDIWYLEDGRKNPNHPMHGIYTGLAEKYKNRQNEEVQN